MFRLRPVCGASFMQGGGRSGRCERMVPALSGEARLGIEVACVLPRDSEIGKNVCGR